MRTAKPMVRSPTGRVQERQVWLGLDAVEQARPSATTSREKPTPITRQAVRDHWPRPSPLDQVVPRPGRGPRRRRRGRGRGTAAARSPGPSPISAAASVITKTASGLPGGEPSSRQASKATRLRLTAFSISSNDISIVIAFAAGEDAVHADAEQRDRQQQRGTASTRHLSAAVAPPSSAAPGQSAIAPISAASSKHREHLERQHPGA